MKRPEGPPTPGRVPSQRPTPPPRLGRARRGGASALPAEQAAAAAKRELRAVRAHRKQRAQEDRSSIRRFLAPIRRRRAAVLGSLVAAVILLLGCVAAAYSPLMAVRHVEVRGASRVDASAVRQALMPQLGTPLPMVSETAVRQALVPFTGIASFAIEAVPPDTLVVRITERVAIGYLQSGSSFSTVDAAGVILASTTAAPVGIPRLDVPGGVSSPGFSALGRVLLQLPAEFRAGIGHARVQTGNDISFTVGPTRITWGNDNQIGLKYRVLTGLLARIGAPARIDVSSPLTPVVS